MSKRKPKQNLTFPILIAAGGLLLLAAAALLLNQNNPGAPQVTSQPTAPSISVPGSDITRVSLEDAKAAYDAGEAIFLDVRLAEAFASSRIQGAVNIPEGELSARIAELDPADWIIPYCT
jgi:hypothetical protein